MAFFRDHWSESHILGNSKELLDWQHRDELEQRYNFLIAVSAKEIVGMLGFIPTNRYDPALSNNAIWLTTWKVRTDHARGLGVHLLRSLTARQPHAWIGTVGLNPSTRAIYELFGYQTGVLSRYFLLNDDLDSFQLVTVPDQFPARRGEGLNTATFSFIDPDDFIPAVDNLALSAYSVVPKKSPQYFYQRYLRHPFYRYQALLVQDRGAAAVLITRRCEHAGRCAIRIVDFLGAPEVMASVAKVFPKLLRQSGAEYLDFYCTGLDAELEAAGLSRQSDVPGLVLPGHFEPFEERNVELTYALKGHAGRMVICKGDADQDRPNSLPLNRQPG